MGLPCKAATPIPLIPPIFLVVPNTLMNAFLLYSENPINKVTFKAVKGKISIISEKSGYKVIGVLTHTNIHS